MAQSDAPSGASRTVRFVVTDGDGGTSTAVTQTVNVYPANDDPALRRQAYAQAYSFVGDAAGVVDAALPWIQVGGRPLIHIDLPGRAARHGEDELVAERLAQVRPRLREILAAAAATLGFRNSLAWVWEASSRSASSRRFSSVTSNSCRSTMVAMREHADSMVSFSRLRVTS